MGGCGCFHPSNLESKQINFPIINSTERNHSKFNDNNNNNICNDNDQSNKEQQQKHTDYTLKTLSKIDMTGNCNSEENKNYLCTLENMPINKIIPEDKLHTTNDNEILFRGELELIGSNNKSFYITLTKLSMNFYENQNHFLSMKKPKLIIYLNQMKNIEATKDKLSNDIYINILLENEMSLLCNSKNKETTFKWIVLLNFYMTKAKQN